MRELIASTWFLPAFSILAALVFLSTHFSNNKWKEIPELSRLDTNLDTNLEAAFDMGQAMGTDPGGAGFFPGGDFFPGLGGGVIPGGGTINGGGAGGGAFPGANGDISLEDFLDIMNGGGGGGVSGGGGGNNDDITAFTYTPTQTPNEIVTFIPVPTSEPKIVVVPPSYYAAQAGGADQNGDQDTSQPYYWVTEYPGQPTPDPILIPVAPPFAKTNFPKNNAGSPVSLKWNIPYGEPTPDPAYLWDPDTDEDLKTAIDNNGSPVYVDWSEYQPALTPVPTDLNYIAKDNNGSPVNVQWQWDIPEGMPTPDPAGLDIAPPSAKKAVNANDGSPVFVTWKFPGQDEGGSNTPSMVPSIPPNNNPNDGSPVSMKWTIPWGEPTPDPVWLDDPATPPALVIKADTAPNNASPVSLKWNIPWGEPTPDPVWLGNPATPPQLLRPSRQIEVGVPYTNNPTVSMYPTEPGATRSPTKEPTPVPTKAPIETSSPSVSQKPSSAPSISMSPTNPGDTRSPTAAPVTKEPTKTPTIETSTPSMSMSPTEEGATRSPTRIVKRPELIFETKSPTNTPTIPLVLDTRSPTIAPTTLEPSISLSPTEPGETRAPTKKPIREVEGDWTPSVVPTITASNKPSLTPSVTASAIPTVTASVTPTVQPAPVMPNAGSPIKADFTIPPAPVPQPVPPPPVVPVPLPTPDVRPGPLPPVQPQPIPVVQPPFPVQPPWTYPPFQPQPTQPYVPQPPFPVQPPWTYPPFQPRPPVPYVPPQPVQPYPPPPWVWQPQPPRPYPVPYPVVPYYPQPPFTPGPPIPAIPWVPGPQIPWWQPPPGWWVTQPVAPVPIYVPPQLPTPQPFRHNQHFVPECNPLQCSLNEDAEFHAMSNEDEAIYELFYTNPIKCCLVVVEIGVGDGERNSFSKYFEDALKWKTLLIEANPEYFEQLKINRPNAAAIENGGFCESDYMEYYPESQTFHMLNDSVEISSELHAPRPAARFGMVKVPCLKMEEVFDKYSITKVDVMVIRVQGDALGFIRNMDWTKRVDIWIILFHDSSSEHITRDLLTQDVMLRNEYVAAEWDIKRWCETLGNCLNNHVFLRKGFNPLPCDYIIPGYARNGNHPKALNKTEVRSHIH